MMGIFGDLRINLEELKDTLPYATCLIKFDITLLQLVSL